MKWLDGLEEAEKGKRIEEAFLRVAKSQDGQVCLYSILTALFFFDPSPGDEERILNNAAKRIVAMMGAEVRYRIFNALPPPDLPDSSQG